MSAPRPGVSPFGSACATALATGLGAGFSPVVPGTVGSLLGIASFLALVRLEPSYQLAVTVFLFLLGLLAAGHTASRLGLEDPAVVVVDEVVGQWVSLLFLPATPSMLAAGFLLFRVLDVTKPYPARELEHLPGGLGIMADDVMAGIYANLLLRVGLLVLPPT